MREVFWGVRIREALADAGFETLRAYLLARPRVSYAALADELGGVAPICVQLYAQYEGRELGDVEFVLRDDLARRLSASLPSGWGRAWERRCAVYAAWDMDVTPDAADQCDRAWSRLERELASPHWRPRDAADPVLLRAFAG